MEFNKDLITTEIKKHKIFDLRIYYILVDKFGELNVNFFFVSLLDVASEEEKARLLDNYYPAYLSIDLNNNELTTDFCLLTVDKYGSNFPQEQTEFMGNTTYVGIDCGFNTLDLYLVTDGKTSPNLFEGIEKEGVMKIATEVAKKVNELHEYYYSEKSKNCFLEVYNG